MFEDKARVRNALDNFQPQAVKYFPPASPLSEVGGEGRRGKCLDAHLARSPNPLPDSKPLDDWQRGVWWAMGVSRGGGEGESWREWRSLFHTMGREGEASEAGTDMIDFRIRPRLRLGGGPGYAARSAQPINAL
ncbi:MAG: hypothetical protein Q9210_002742 [Variospora velana]